MSPTLVVSLGGGSEEEWILAEDPRELEDSGFLDALDVQDLK